MRTGKVDKIRSGSREYIGQLTETRDLNCGIVYMFSGIHVSGPHILFLEFQLEDVLCYLKLSAMYYTCIILCSCILGCFFCYHIANIQLLCRLPIECI